MKISEYFLKTNEDLQKLSDKFQNLNIFLKII